jgi:probable rRNA maturation factor
MTRLYLPPLRIDVTVRDGVPRVAPLAGLGRAIRAAALAAAAPTPASVGLVLTDDADMAALNRAHLGRRGPTDVLSFPLLPPETFRGEKRTAGATVAAERFALPPGVRVSLGDIAVSVERAIAQAREGRGGQDSRTGWSPVDELLLLVTHGTLHLCGWDHADPGEHDAMRVLERSLLEGLGFTPGRTT